jgi:hypothetical protein
MLPTFEIQSKKLVAELVSASVRECQRVAVASASARGWPLQMAFAANVRLMPILASMQLLAGSGSSATF